MSRKIGRKIDFGVDSRKRMGPRKASLRVCTSPRRIPMVNPAVTAIRNPPRISPPVTRKASATLGSSMMSTPAAMIWVGAGRNTGLTISNREISSHKPTKASTIPARPSAGRDQNDVRGELGWAAAGEPSVVASAIPVLINTPASFRGLPTRWRGRGEPTTRVRPSPAPGHFDRQEMSSQYSHHSSVGASSTSVFWKTAPAASPWSCSSEAEPSSLQSSMICSRV